MHEPTDAEKGIWALDANAFRRAAPGLFVRPDNFAPPTADLRALLVSLGLPRRASLIAGTPVDDHGRWSTL